MVGGVVWVQGGGLRGGRGGMWIKEVWGVAVEGVLSWVYQGVTHGRWVLQTLGHLLAPPPGPSWQLDNYINTL